MLTISNKDVSKIDRFTDKEFELWLETGLRSYLTEGVSTSSGVDAPFYPLQNLVAISPYLYTDLENIYDAFSPKTKIEFQKGMGLLISKLNYDKIDYKIFEELLFLIGVIKAYEALPNIEQKIRDGYFEYLDNSEARRLNRWSVETMSGLATKGKPIVNECLNKLISSKRNFDPHLLQYVLPAMCKVDNEKYPEHCFAVHHYFKDLSDEVLGLIARYSIYQLPLNTVAANFMSFFDDPIAANPQIVRFLHVLFLPTTPLYKITLTNRGAILIRSEDDAQRIISFPKQMSEDTENRFFHFNREVQSRYSAEKVSQLLDIPYNKSILHEKDGKVETKNISLSLKVTSPFEDQFMRGRSKLTL